MEQTRIIGKRLGVKGLQFQRFHPNDTANLALTQGEIDWAGNFVPAIDRIFVERNPDSTIAGSPWSAHRSCYIESPDSTLG